MASETTSYRASAQRSVSEKERTDHKSSKSEQIPSPKTEKLSPSSDAQKASKECCPSFCADPKQRKPRVNKCKRRQRKE